MCSFLFQAVKQSYSFSHMQETCHLCKAMVYLKTRSHTRVELLSDTVPIHPVDVPGRLEGSRENVLE